MLPEASLPPIDQALLPPEARAGGAEGARLYAAALGFESLLVQQLASQLAASAGLDGGSDPDGAAASPYAALLPDALAQAVSAGGGLGLAPQIYQALTLQEKASS
ncbi:MAG: hypothetical protein IRZ20_08355 [Thermoleophilia bacterium]|nr:hypothetical protein [Thermoleophilia bacterium]